MAAHAMRIPPRAGGGAGRQRILGLLATAALLGSGVAIATMVMPAREDDGAAAHAAARRRGQAGRQKKPAALTKAQKRARHAARSRRCASRATSRCGSPTGGRRRAARAGRARPTPARCARSSSSAREFVGHDDPATSSNLRVAKSGQATRSRSPTASAPAAPRRSAFELQDGALAPPAAPSRRRRSADLVASSGMCGRYTLTTPRRPGARRALRARRPRRARARRRCSASTSARPSRSRSRSPRTTTRVARTVRWGLVPPWARELRQGLPADQRARRDGRRPSRRSPSCSRGPSGAAWCSPTAGTSG